MLFRKFLLRVILGCNWGALLFKRLCLVVLNHLGIKSLLRAISVVGDGRFICKIGVRILGKVGGNWLGVSSFVKLALILV